jgi:capping protein alpha
MSDDDDGGAGEQLTDGQKREIAVWFLSNAPAGEIRYVAKGNRPHLITPARKI